MHTYIHTYARLHIIHTYTHTYTHTYFRYIHTYIHTYIHVNTCTGHGSLRASEACSRSLERLGLEYLDMYTVLAPRGVKLQKVVYVCMYVCMYTYVCITSIYIRFWRRKA